MQAVLGVEETYVFIVHSSVLRMLETLVTCSTWILLLIELQNWEIRMSLFIAGVVRKLQIQW